MLETQRHVPGHRAGTLIEVLVSLLILTLVLSTMLSVSVHQRKTAADAVRSREGLHLAITWQSARLAKATWTQGDTGYFPDPPEARWTLEQATNADVSGSGSAPDKQWRMLRVMQTNDDLGISFLFRIDAPRDPVTGALQ